MFEMQRNLLAAGLTAAVLGGAIGCNQRAAATNRDTNKDGVVDTIATAKDNDDWTDARILRVLATANTLDSTLGAFATKAAHSPGIKDYARTMMRDHGAANKNLHDLGIKANIPFDSTHTGDGDPKPEMVEDASDKLDDLRKLQGTDFDKGYMKAEMDRHEDLLKKIDKDLIPHAIHLDLRGFLEKLRPTVVAHLERATMLKNELDRGAVPGTR